VVRSSEESLAGDQQPYERQVQALTRNCQTTEEVHNVVRSSEESLAGDQQPYERQLRAVVPIGNLPSKRMNITDQGNKAKEMKQILLQNRKRNK
jgi:hypothetical protein